MESIFLLQKCTSSMCYIYAFSRRFYPKRLTIAFRLYICISTWVPWESNPQPFAQLAQCSTTEPQEHRLLAVSLRNVLAMSEGKLFHFLRAYQFAQNYYTSLKVITINLF